MMSACRYVDVSITSSNQRSITRTASTSCLSRATSAGGVGGGSGGGGVDGGEVVDGRGGYSSTFGKFIISEDHVTKVQIKSEPFDLWSSPPSSSSTAKAEASVDITSGPTSGSASAAAATGYALQYRSSWSRAGGAVRPSFCGPVKEEREQDRPSCIFTPYVGGGGGSGGGGVRRPVLGVDGGGGQVIGGVGDPMNGVTVGRGAPHERWRMTAAASYIRSENCMEIGEGGGEAGGDGTGDGQCRVVCQTSVREMEPDCCQLGVRQTSVPVAGPDCCQLGVRQASVPVAGPDCCQLAGFSSATERGSCRYETSHPVKVNHM